MQISAVLPYGYNRMQPSQASGVQNTAKFSAIIKAEDWPDFQAAYDAFRPRVEKDYFEPEVSKLTRLGGPVAGERLKAYLTAFPELGAFLDYLCRKFMVVNIGLKTPIDGEIQATMDQDGTPCLVTEEDVFDLFSKTPEQLRAKNITNVAIFTDQSEEWLGKKIMDGAPIPIEAFYREDAVGNTQQKYWAGLAETMNYAEYEEGPPQLEYINPELVQAMGKLQTRLLNEGKITPAQKLGDFDPALMPQDDDDYE